MEQQLYQRLIRAFPNHTVLAQVSFSQLVGVKKGQKNRSVWNRFNRLTADFVLCKRDFSVAAVLELDDRSHDSTCSTSLKLTGTDSPEAPKRSDRLATSLPSSADLDNS